MRTGRILRLVLVALLSASVAGCLSAPLEPHHAPPAEGVRVMSYNVRFADLSRGEERVLSHAAEIASVLTTIRPDLAGLQEVVTADYPIYVRPDPLLRALKDALPEYGWIAPEGASLLSQSNPILYRRDRYMPVEQGVEWFSESPTIPDTTGWGNALPRYLIWATFYDASAQMHLTVANLHLDHLSRKMNRRAIDRLVVLLQERFRGHPLILLGDFNEPASGVTRAALEAYVTPVLTPADGPSRAGLLSLQIDAIYVTSHFTVLDAGIVREPSLVRGTSDHRPVVADLGMSFAVQE